MCRKIYVAKNVHLQECIRDVFANCLKTEEKINSHQRDANFVVVWDVIPSKNHKGHPVVIHPANLSQVKVFSEFMMKWSIT